MSASLSNRHALMSAYLLAASYFAQCPSASRYSEMERAALAYQSAAVAYGWV